MSITSQLDMFNERLVPLEVPQNHTSRAARRQASLSEEQMVDRLAETGRYRVLRKLTRRPVCIDPRPGFPRIGVIVDTETTGLNHRSDELIEIGVVAFTFDDLGAIGDVIDVYGSLQQPKTPIPPSITDLTGISDEMVFGQTIDMRTLTQIVDKADLIIAHNAKFDRPFCETLSSSFAPKAWACSVVDISWRERGFEGTKLAYLIGQAGFFHDGHRAVDDCFALLEVLSTRSSQASNSPFSELYDASQRSRARIWAENAPFDMKEKLKARGYRWSNGEDGLPKSWWTEVSDILVADELRFLRTEVYLRADVEPRVRSLTSVDRFKAC